MTVVSKTSSRRAGALLRERRGAVAVRCALAALAACSLPALSQDLRDGRTLTITPSLEVSETYTDGTARTNSSATGGRVGGEFATRISPGLSIASRSGRVQGTVDYALSATHYSAQSQSQTVQNSLNAALTAEAIERLMYLDARANIAQQTISPFAQQTATGSQRSNPNSTEVTTLSLSPYVRRSVGGWADFEGRLTAGATRSRGQTNPSSKQLTGSLSLASAATGARFGWSLNGVGQRVRFGQGQDTDSSRVNGRVTMRPDYDLRLALGAGLETTNVGGTARRSYSNWGGGLRWTPTERTVIEADIDRRYFGRSFRVVAEHRTPRTVWRYADSRDLTSGSDANGVGQPVTLYQLYYALFASSVPDPGARDQFVRDFLRQLGRDGGEVVSGGFLGSAVTVQRRQDLSFAWVGLRTSFSLQAFGSETRQIDGPGGTVSAERTRQVGYTGTVSHRLTPLSSLNLTGAQQKTLGQGLRGGNDLKSLALGWSTQLGQRTSLGLTARYAVFNNAIDPYREASIAASLSQRF
jgi:uncharacterized protein (PEP-CTERM system associated)